MPFVTMTMDEVLGFLVLTASNLLVLFILAYVSIWPCLFWLRDEIVIRRLGGHAPSVHSKWDLFGLKYLMNMFQHARRDENLKFFHACLVTTGRRKTPNPFTYEFTFAGQRRLVTADPENIKAMLATQFQDFGKGNRFRQDWKGLLGRSIFTLDGAEWHRNRQFLRPHFARRRISDLECFERHLSDLWHHLDSGKTVGIKEIMALFAFDAAADFSLGIQVRSLVQPSNEFIEAFERCHHTQTMVEYLAPFGWWLVPKKQYERDLKTMQEFVDPILDKALAMSADELHKLVDEDENADNRSGVRFSFLAACTATSRNRAFLRDTIISIVLAARDTTAMTLTWCLFELARNPQIVADLRAEIMEKLGPDPDAKPSYQDLKDMTLLRHILDETLRLYPSIPYNAREAACDTTLPKGGGKDGQQKVGVRKGTLIYFCPHILHLRNDIYPQDDPSFPKPEEFHPQRWENWRPTPWTYMPFGGGPRTCIGQQFALVEMSYVLVRLFQRYKGLELRQQPKGDEQSSSKWKRHDPARPELAELYMGSRPKMASEITLNPREEIHVMFVE